MSERSRPKLDASQLHQVCVVVRDLEKSMEHYQNTLGIGPWEVSEWDDSNISEMTYHGRPARHRFRVALTMVGPMQLELIQPLEGENLYSDFLKEHGEGLHHLGHVMVDNTSEAIPALEKEGFRCLQRRLQIWGLTFLRVGNLLSFRA